MHRHTNKWSCIRCLNMATSIGQHAPCVECSGELSCVQHVWNVLSVCFILLLLCSSIVDVLSSLFFIFFPIYLKFSHLLSMFMFIRRSDMNAIVWNCIDIGNLWLFFLQRPFFSSNIFWFYISSSEKKIHLDQTKVVESFIHIFPRFRFGFILIFVVVVAVYILSLSLRNAALIC